MENLDIDYLKGMTLSNVTDINLYGDKWADEFILFESTKGKLFIMFHEQEGSENIYIESIEGELEDLIGSPILISEEVSEEEITSDGTKLDYYNYRWTFYKIVTIKGTIVIRWCADSNGYYSERVDFKEVDKEHYEWYKKLLDSGVKVHTIKN